MRGEQAWLAAWLTFQNLIFMAVLYCLKSVRIGNWEYFRSVFSPNAGKYGPKKLRNEDFLRSFVDVSLPIEVFLSSLKNKISGSNTFSGWKILVGGKIPQSAWSDWWNIIIMLCHEEDWSCTCFCMYELFFWFDLQDGDCLHVVSQNFT